MDQHSFNYKIVVAYDGTNYCGWQEQPNDITIQEVLERTIAIPLRHEVKVIGSSRTDAGVHAKGQVANFYSPLVIDKKRFLLSINALLPKDISIKDISVVSEKFHSRYSAKGKIYRYYLHLDNVRDPFNSRYSYHVFKQLDVDLLRQAAKKFVGTYDFTSFGNIGGATKENCIRTLTRVDIVEIDGGLYIEMEGPGFLYKMVRNIVGTLVDVACKKRPLDDIEEIFAAKDRRCASQTAPGKGLFLMEVFHQECFSNS